MRADVALERELARDDVLDGDLLVPAVAAVALVAARLGDVLRATQRRSSRDTISAWILRCHRQDDAMPVRRVDAGRTRNRTRPCRPTHRAGCVARVLDVFLQHPARRESRRDREDRLLDHREPAARDAARVALVERRDDLAPRAAGRALRRRHRRSASPPDRPGRRRSASRSSREPFGPPAVADAEVEDAVHRRLHAARAARFERLARRVEPDVAALHQQVRDVQVVVVDERDAAAELRIERVPEHRLKMMLARFVGRMRFAGEDELDRPARRRSAGAPADRGSRNTRSGRL